MGPWNYKGIAILQTSRKTKTGRWLSTAGFKVNNCGYDITAYWTADDGFDSRDRAEQATAQFVREHIDRIK